MKLRCGPSKEVREAEALKRRQIAEDTADESRKRFQLKLVHEFETWQPTFAWWPTQIGSHDCRWLETVERRLIKVIFSRKTNPYQYRTDICVSLAHGSYNLYSNGICRSVHDGFGHPNDARAAFKGHLADCTSDYAVNSTFAFKKYYEYRAVGKQS